MKLKLIMMFVDVPKPLSTMQDGTVSSIALGVVQMRTPHEKPNTNLPKHIMQNTGMKLIKVPIKPMTLNYKMVCLRPDLTKSPPKTEPMAIPAIAAVHIKVMLKSMIDLSLPQ